MSKFINKIKLIYFDLRLSIKNIIKWFRNSNWRRYSKNWKIKKRYPIIHKKQIITRIKESYPRITKKKIDIVINQTFNTIAENIKQNKKIIISDLGTFTFLPAEKNKRQNINNIKFKASKKFVEKISSTTWTGKYWSKVKNPHYFWQTKKFKKSLVLLLLILLFSSSITTISVISVSIVNKDKNQNQNKIFVDYDERKYAIEEFSNNKIFNDIQEYENKVANFNDEKISIIEINPIYTIKEVTKKIQLEISLQIKNPFLWKDSKTNEVRTFTTSIEITNNDFIETMKIQKTINDYTLTNEFQDEGEFVYGIQNELRLPNSTNIQQVTPNNELTKQSWKILIGIEDGFVWEDSTNEAKWFSAEPIFVDRIVSILETKKTINEALSNKTFESIEEVETTINELNNNSKYMIIKNDCLKASMILSLIIVLNDKFVWDDGSKQELLILVPIKIESNG